MKQYPLQLRIGSVIVLLLALMILFPVLFTRTNPYSTESMRFQTDSAGHFAMQRAPFPPQLSIPLGTDEMGRQIWPLIVYGTRLTLLLAFLIVAGRFLLALPIGFLAGFGSVTARTAIQQFAVVFGTIPALLLSVIVLKMNFFTALDKNASILAFVAVLTIVGWGRLGQMIQYRVEVLMKEPFVQGEIAIGKNRLQIATGTVLNHLLPELLIFFFLEMTRALTMLLQLGIFAVFVGNVRFIESTDNGIIKVMDMSYEPEWASILGAARKNIRSAPWTVLFPALAFFISVMGLNAFGEGLRSLLQQKTERAAVGLKTRRSMRILAGVLCVLFILQSGIPAVYRATLFDYKAGITETLKLEQGPVIIGNGNSIKTAEWLGAQLKSKGLYPLNSPDYIHPYDGAEAFYPLSQRVELDSGSALQQLSPGRDYQMISYGSFDVSSTLLDCADRDLYQMTEADVSQPGILLLDAGFYTRESILFISRRLAEFPNVKGLVWLTDMKSLRMEQIGTEPSGTPALYLDRSLIPAGKKEAVRLTVRIDSRQTDGTGRNVVAYIPGSSDRLGEEAILYGFSYNALTPEETRVKLAYSLAFIDGLTKDITSRKRTIIVAFFDGTLGDDFNGMKAYAAEKPYSQKDTMLYVDMTRIAGIPEGRLVADQKQSPITRYYAYTFALQLDQRLKRAGWEPEALGATTETDSQIFIGQGTPTIILGLKAPEQGQKAVPLDKLGKTVIQTISANNY